jgi:hypothetical protein
MTWKCRIGWHKRVHTTRTQTNMVSEKDICLGCNKRWWRSERILIADTVVFTPKELRETRKKFKGLFKDLESKS